MLVQTPVKLIRSTVRAHRPRRYYMLLACILALTALAPLVEHMWWARVIVAIDVVVAVLMAAITAEVSGRSRKIALLFAGLTGIIWIVAFSDLASAFEPKVIQLTACGITFLFFAGTGAIMLKDIYSGEVTSNRIAGAICVYLLIGLCFALINMMVFTVNPSSFKDSSAADKEHSLSANLSQQQRFPIFLYLSFCTLSTVGYGDLAPVTRLARTLAWLEGISGQIYLTVLVARLVGLHIAYNTQPKED